jgi:TP901 family phage tail tape measure protein
MATPMKLALVLSAIDKASAIINGVVANATRKFDALTKQSDKLAKSSSDFGKSAITMGAVAGAALAPTVTAFAQAEEAATSLKATMMGANGEVAKEFDAINKLANELGGKLPGTTADFQNMMNKLIQQGISVKAVLGGVGKAAAYIGIQMKMPFEEAAVFAAKLQDATKTTESDMLSLMDVVQKSYGLGVDPANMQQGFSKLSSAMGMIKMQGLEGAKALAPLLVMADQMAMAGEAAGNAYRKVFQASFNTDKVAKANKALSGQGLNLKFTDSKGEFGGIDNMFAQLEKLKGLSTEKRTGIIKTLFGDDAETLQVVSLMMDKGINGYNETIKKMDAQASLQQRVDAQLGTLKNTWDAATGAMTNTLAAVGEQLAPTLKELSTWFGEVSQNVGAWIKENPALTKGIALAVGGFALLAVGMGAVSMLFSGIFKLVGMVSSGFSMLAKVLGFAGKAFMVMGKAVMWLGRMMMMNPIGLLITAIAVAAGLIIYYWDEIVAFFTWLWGKVKKIFWDFWEWVSGWAMYFWDVGVSIVTNLWNGIKSVFFGMVRWIRENLYNIPVIGDMLKGQDPMHMMVQNMSESKQLMELVKSGDKGAIENVQNLANLGYNLDALVAAIPKSAAATTGGTALSKSAVTNNTGGTGAVNYQPQITINGDMTPETQKRFEDMLKQNKDEVGRIVDTRNARTSKLKLE